VHPENAWRLEVYSVVDSGFAHIHKALGSMPSTKNSVWDISIDDNGIE
jgi:hypothetical protein